MTCDPCPDFDWPLRLAVARQRWSMADGIGWALVRVRDTVIRSGWPGSGGSDNEPQSLSCGKLKGPMTHWRASAARAL